MKLGTKTGSLINHILSEEISEAPYVGMPATLLSWTDRNPATVIEVNMTKRYIVVQEDDYERLDSNGMSESQEYRYTQNDENHKTYAAQGDDAVFEEDGK